MSKSLSQCLHLLIFFAIFNFTTAIMSGGYVALELGGSQEISTYGVTFFGLGNALIFPLGNHLKLRFSPFKILFHSTILFALTTYLCGAAPTFIFFNIFRFLAGIASGIFIPLSLDLLFFCEPEKKESNFVFFALLATVFPVVGACFGGWIAYDLEWRWIFYSQIPFIAGLAYILYRHEEPYPLKEHPPFDFTGYLFYALSLSAIITSLTLAQQLDWLRSPLICVLFTISGLCLPFFCLWEWNHQNPFFDVKLFKLPIFSLSILCLIFLFSAYFGMILLLSLWLNIDATYTPLWISLLLAHMAIAGGVLFFLLKKWFCQVASLWIVLIGAALFAISCFYSTAFNAEINFGRLAIARVIAGFGLAFFLYPLLFALLKKLPEKLHAQGLAIFQSLRLLAGSLGCAVYTTIWFRRRIFYHERLGEQLTIYSEQTDQYLSNLSFYGSSGVESDILLNQALGQQADVLALADTFYLMGWLMVGVFVITLSYLIGERFKKKAAEKPAAFTSEN